MFGYARPIFTLIINDQDITTAIDNRLISLSLTDNRGFEADQLDVELSDHDGKLALPSNEGIVKLSLGWSDTGLVDKGEYVIDEISHSGAPDKLTLRARSVDLCDQLNSKKERSWHGVTIGEIVRTIAGEVSVETVIDPILDAEMIDHLDQTNESNANFLTRLAQQYDAIITVKNDKMLCMRAGQCTTAGGKPLDAVELTRQSGDGHSYTLAARDSYTGVTARYQDKGRGEEKTITLRKKKGNPEGEEVVDDKKTKNDFAAGADNIKTLRHLYPTKEAALNGARSALQKLTRGKASFSLALDRARPELFPELPVTLSGWKPEIDSTEWILTKVSHSLNDSGYTMALELEMKGDEEAEEDMNDT